MYLQFVSKSYMNSPDYWPPHFKRLLASALAVDAGPALKIDEMVLRRAEVRHGQNLTSAKKHRRHAVTPAQAGGRQLGGVKILQVTNIAGVRSPCQCHRCITSSIEARSARTR